MKQSSSDIFKKNLALLKKNHPHVYPLIHPVKEAFSSDLQTLPNGHKAIRLQKTNGEPVILYDQTTDESNIGFVSGDFYGLIYLIGMGMGYTAMALVQNKPDMRFLAIFEPDAEIFSQVLHVTDLTAVLSDPRVLISIGENPDLNRFLAPARNVLMTESLCYRKHLPSFSLNPAYERLSRIVFDYTSLHVISGGTLSSYGRLFFRNRLLNLRTLHHYSLFESLKNIFHGRPAILVGAGPSLNMNARYLKYAKGKAVIICVDSALPALVRNGVTPDFVTTMDAFEFSYEKIADQATFGKGISLICTPIVNVKAPKIFPAEHMFWAFTEGEPDKWMNEISGGREAITGAETVAHLNLFSAMMMGCSPIVFVGQDLAYSTSESHATHTVLSSKNLMEADLKSGNKVVWVKGVNGLPVQTGLSYYNMKLFFEEIIRRHKGVYLNATEGGAHIEGTEILPLKQVIDRYCINFTDVSGKVEAVVKLAPKRDHHPIRQRILEEIKRIADLDPVLDRSLKLSQKILSDLDRIKKGSPAGQWNSMADIPKEIQQTIQENDAVNARLDQALDIWGRLTEITITCLKESERIRHDMRLIEKEKGRFADWLTRREERLVYINAYRKDVLSEYHALLNRVVGTCDLEQEVIRKMDASSDNKDPHLFHLACHYFNEGDLMLSLPLFKALSKNETFAKEAFFHLGCIALNHAEYEDARAFFQRAKSNDPSMEDREKVYAEKLGSDYLGYSRRTDIDQAASRKLLIKGLRYAPFHDELIADIKSRFDSDFSNIDDRIEQGAEELISVINSWLDDFSRYPELKACFDHTRMGDLYALHGRILALKENFEEAERKFSKAIEHAAENPYFHALIADAYFAQDKYNLGVMHLNKAVQLDRAYAGCWADLGDALYGQEQYADALSAYEMCFKSMPENRDALKKIGECYLKLGKSEAAEEAFRQFDKLNGK